MEKTYNPSSFEEILYLQWLQKNLFSSKKDREKKPYVIVMPPPNITGRLHMGHVLNNTIQDVLARKARMENREVCWVPGIDHASIATEAKVVALLSEKGISKKNISREEFLKHVWEWKNKYGDIILSQLKKLGVSCDWERVTFTLDDDMYRAVQKIFVKLYQDGLIYRDTKIINWDPKGKTSLSDDEVIHKPTKSKLYFIKYKIVNEQTEIIVATTRPETIFGDVAICCNPKDKRYTHLKGKKAIVPIIEREIPIIFDDYVDETFGTGCLKITPAHDFNDYTIGKKFSLEEINIFNDDATLNEMAGKYNGEERFIARKKITEELEAKNCIIKIEDIENSIGHSERTDAIIEPKISTQWFLKMENIVLPAIEATKNGSITFFPKKFINTYNIWLNTIRDWCISRQLWWGHRIPAYYLTTGECFVAESLEEALAQAKQKTNNDTLTEKDLKQDEDVLDTWFSSWIWPIEVFKGISHPHNSDFNYYYPTNDLVTAPEIIFFWVARMIIAGYYFTGKAPFKRVYFTGIVRDKKGRKMSKSLGNSPEPVDLIEQYGADGVRMGLMMSASAGNDVMFDEALCILGKNFANKLWNAAIFIQNLKETSHNENSNDNINAWLKTKFAETRSKLEKEFENYRISQAATIVYKFFWDDFCSLYIEMLKASGQIDKQTHEFIKKQFFDILKMLHPFMPFITEKIWLEMNNTKSISLANYPPITNVNNEILKYEANFTEFLKSIRTIRKENNIHKSKSLDIFIKNERPSWVIFFEREIFAILNINFIDKENIDDHKIYIDGDIFSLSKDYFEAKQIDKKSLVKELQRLEVFLTQVNAKLNSEKFLQNAKIEIINLEKKKKEDTNNKISIIKQQLS